MIVTLLNSHGSCKGALDYSEQKVDRCVASVQAVRNLPDDIPMVIYDTLLEYEQNPRVAKQMRDFKFHMAVSPGPKDGIDREGCVRLIDELMEKAGFADQPYVIYRHNDIEREHFHVVSVRVNRKGKAIYEHFEGEQITSFCRELESKYGFRIGCERSAREDEAVGLKESFDYSLGNTFAQMRDTFESACLYAVDDERKLAELLRQKNLLYKTTKNRRGEDVVVLQGLNRAGKTVTRPVSVERQLNIPAFERVRETLSRGRTKEDMLYPAIRAEVLMKQTAALTPTASHFIGALAQMDLAVTLRRTEEHPQSIDGGYIIDSRNGVVFSLDELSPSLSMMLREMESGENPKWKRASRMEARRIAGTKVLPDWRIDEMETMALNEYNARTFASGVARTAARTDVQPAEQIQTTLKH